MRTRVSLYEFMPYGAPELIESRQRHLSRALIVTSATALALYALTTGIAALLPDAPVRVPIMPSVSPKDWVLPPVLEPPAPPPLAPKPAAPHAAPPVAAPPLPVPDPIAPPVTETTPPGTATATDAAPGPSAPTGETGTQTGPAVERLPALGEWVYVEKIPAAIREVKPEYPDLAREAQIEGVVVVQVLVGRDGHVLRAELSPRQQVPMLNTVALAAARQWLFTPGMANEHPVVCWTAITFRFTLR